MLTESHAFVLCVQFNIDASVATTLNSDLSGTVVVGAASVAPTSYASQWKAAARVPRHRLVQADHIHQLTDFCLYVCCVNNLCLLVLVSAASCLLYVQQRSVCVVAGELKPPQPTLSVSIDGLGGPNLC